MCFTHGVLIGAGAVENRLVLTYPELIISITIIVTVTLSTTITVTSVITSLAERGHAFFFTRVRAHLVLQKILSHSHTSRKHGALPCILSCRLLRNLRILLYQIPAHAQGGQKNPVSINDSYTINVTVKVVSPSILFHDIFNCNHHLYCMLL